MTSTPDTYRLTVTYASDPAPGPRVNEDLVVASNRFAVVLDGASHAPGVETGCVHDVPWLVGQLGSQLADVLLNEQLSLSDALATTIERVRARHADTCDLDNPDSPSATVAILRLEGDRVDYLVLADSPVILRDRNGSVMAIRDDRLDHLPDYSVEGIRTSRNLAGGFWVASTSIRAAYEAVTGSIAAGELELAALLTDGVTRLVERHGWTWDGLLGLLSADGPDSAIDAVRRADRERVRLPTDRGKAHDDATAALCRLAPAI